MPTSTILLLFFLLVKTGFSQSQPKAREILTKMVRACETVTRYSTDLTKVERFDAKNNLRETKLTIKAITQPDFKINVVIKDSDTFGESGSELIFPAKPDIAYLKGWRSTLKGKYHNIYQDDVIRAKDKEHHTFSHIGFQYLIKIVTYYQKKDTLKFYNSIRVVENQIYYEFTIDDPQYNENLIYQIHQSGETIISIADALHLNQFKVWELNKGKKIDYLTPLKISETLHLPSSYARKTVLHIDKISFLPLTQIIYDNHITIPYEKYIFEKFNLNPITFSNETFHAN